jgi:ribosomal protein S18 acetylase RimI-like enzyme
MPNALEPVLVTRTYLEMRQRPAQPPEPWPEGVTLAREEPCSVALARALYVAVGRAYHWYDRDAWTDERLAAHLNQPGILVCVLREQERPLGYFELALGDDKSTEIVYFGLVAAGHGRGLGRRLLQHAIQRGFDMGAERVWLHTCTLDGPAALPNYKSRGFQPFRTEQYEMRMPGLT